MKNSFEDYYVQQAGRGMPVFTGARHQRGYGLGNVIKGVFRSAVPLLKQAALTGFKEVGKSLLTQILPGSKTKSKPRTKPVKQTGWTQKQRVVRKNAVKRKAAPLATTRKRKMVKHDDIFL